MPQHRLVLTLALGAWLCTGTASAEPSAGADRPIEFDQPLTGHIDDIATQVAFRLNAQAGDVLNAEIGTTSGPQVSQSLGKSLQELDSHVTILDPEGKELVSSVPDRSMKTFSWQTHTVLFAVIPADGAYAVLAERSPGSRLTGDFELVMTKLPVIRIGETARKTLKVQDVKDRQFGAAYAVQSHQDFAVTFQKTGAFSPTLYVSTIAGKEQGNMASPNSRLQPVAAITGPKNNFTTLNDAAMFKGGRLLIAGRKEPYIITLYNRDEFDNTFHLSDREANASADCEVTLTEAKQGF